MKLNLRSMRAVVARWLAGTGMLCLALGGVDAGARSVAKEAEQLRQRTEADTLFGNSPVLHLRLEIDKESLESLRKNPHKYARATLHDGGMVYSNVAVHVKGSVGSFRKVEEKPGLTLNFGTFVPDAPRFHGLKKLHLNNSVQDPSYLSEFVCDEMFRAAGVPATRAAHALVELNGKKLGLYVLLESMDKDFLLRSFQNPKGNLYGQPGGGDVTDGLERMEGDGPLTRDDLKTLADAAQEKDPDRRLEALQRTLDVNRFISFMALEVMFCHWDGYTFARHNYRVYHDLDTERMVFFPHDVDQMFRNADEPILPGVNGVVAQAILRTPKTRSLYRQRVREIFTNVYVLPVITNRLDQRVAQMLPTLKASDAGLAREFVNNANELKSRLIARRQGLEKLLNQPVKTLRFEQDAARLSGWRVENEKGGAKLEQGREKDGKQTLRITATGTTASSWRTRVQLDGGRYRFEGLARCAALQAVHEETKGEGAGLRISGSQEPRPNKLTGDVPWQKLEYEFDVMSPNDEVDLVCELRASKGDVWFDADSLRLVRLK